MAATPSIAMNVKRAEKTCAMCQEKLPRERFPLKGRKNDRRYHVCDECYPKYRKTLSNRTWERTKERMKSTVPVDREKTPMIPVGPIRRWLTEELGVPTIDTKLSEDEKGRVKEVAEWLQTSERQIHRWRSGESEATSLDAFDRCLCNAGVPWVLKDLFPELWEFDDAEIRQDRGTLNGSGDKR